MSEQQKEGFGEPRERLEHAINRAERVLITTASGEEVRGVLVGMDEIGLAIADEGRRQPVIVAWTAVALIAVQPEGER